MNPSPVTLRVAVMITDHTTAQRFKFMHSLVGADGATEAVAYPHTAACRR